MRTQSLAHARLYFVLVDGRREVSSLPRDEYNPSEARNRETTLEGLRTLLLSISLSSIVLLSLVLSSAERVA